MHIHRRTKLAALVLLTGTAGACQLVAGLGNYHETGGTGGGGATAASSGKGGASSTSGKGAASSTSGKGGASSTSGMGGAPASSGIGASSTSSTVGPSSTSGTGGATASSGTGGATASSGVTSTNASSSTGCGNTSSSPHNCGACGHDCLGGQCMGGACQPNVIIDDPSTRITGFALATDGSGTATTLFWLDAGNGVTNGSVMLLLLATPTVHSPVTANQCGPIAIAANATDVYWLNSGVCPVDAGNNGGEVWQANTGGTNAQLLQKYQQAPTAIVATSAGVAWITAGDANINRILQSTGMLASPYTPSYSPLALAADGTAFYWTSSFKGVGSVTWNLTNPLTYSNDVATFGAIAPPVGSQGPYWIEGSGVMYWDGTQALSLTASQGAPQGITSDTSGVYWTDASGSIMRAPVNGGIATTIITGQDSPAAILTDQVSIFWLSHTASGDTITRLAK